MNKFVKTALAFSLAASVAIAGEFPIGDPVEINGMEIAAVYLEPIDMEPKGIDLAPSKAGEWIPYLKVNYELKNLDNGKVKKGTFMPMVAQDGPHYGANLKMDTGVGNYELKFHIENPEKQGFGRHADKETGVGKWFEPFTTTYKFQYTGAPAK